MKKALIMAGGTGGHIFPGLAVAQALMQNGWSVRWLGTPDSMEARIVPEQAIALDTIAFSGVRGNGWKAKLWLPWRLARAFVQSWQIIQAFKPDVVIGFGGYVTMPGGLAAFALRKPLVLHEQNSVAGMANRWLARIASRTFAAFPDALPQAQWVGNPLRPAFTSQAVAAQRFKGRQGPMQVVVIGGSQGARALNEVVPKALALLAPAARPQVLHQGGHKQMQELTRNYVQAQVQARLVPFIDDMAGMMAQADLVICRAGASTVTELAAIGAAALFVPFPYAVDDHQTSNARFLVAQDAGWLIAQNELTPQWLADFLSGLDREQLQRAATRARALAQTEATPKMVRTCEELSP